VIKEALQPHEIKRELWKLKTTILALRISQKTTISTSRISQLFSIK